MSKIGLIIRREYTTRVMKKSFIILTFLTPVLLAALVMVPLLLSKIKDDSVKTIVVVDQTGLYKSIFRDSADYQYKFADVTPEEYRKGNEENEIDALLLISEDLIQNPKAAVLFSEKQIDMDMKGHIGRLLRNFVEEQKLAALNIPDFKKIAESLKTDIDVKTVKWGKDGEEKMGSAELAVIIGMLSAFIIYMFIVIYGAQVMSGVVQEKTNRIVEVIISSVKPFELMMGKIIGVAMVGLTQFGLWVILSLVLVTALTNAIGVDAGEAARQQSQMMGVHATAMPMDTGDETINELLVALQEFDFVQTGILFVLFFLGGYLLYSSLFAAIGSAVDNETDTQQFSLPVTLPIIFAIYAAIYSAENPDGPLALWCSFIPFTSPIVMMVRLPFGVPFWQIALSLGILIMSFIGSTWVAAKIYRTGILMYGKKVTWKEMFKWITYKD
jgi:ABC-2 type transport system permease protein